MRILPAEDERDLNRILGRQLTREGYSVDCVFDGEEASEALRAGADDCETASTHFHKKSICNALANAMNIDYNNSER